jgi:penicillin-binding protein 1A
VKRALLVLFGLFVMGVCGAAGAAWIAYQSLTSDLPDLRSLDDYRPYQTTRVLARDGQLIGEFYEQRRTVVRIEDIPKLVIDAFVAAEDDTFFEHTGIDYESILRAAWVNLRAGGKIRQGASTITQQTVKGLLLTPEKDYRRKLREMILARRIEERLSKQEILSLYLNTIYFGHGAYGVAEAARTYYGKALADLDASEAALLAGLPQRPSEYSPFVDPESADDRRRYVLRRMLEEGYLDADAFESALARPPAIARKGPREETEVAATFTEEVRRYLYRTLGGERTLRGGFTVETTLDLALQRQAVSALRSGLRQLDRRQGYRGPLRRVERADLEAVLDEIAQENGLAAGAELGAEPEEGWLGVVLRVDEGGQKARVALARGLEGEVALADASWARTPDPERESYAIDSISKAFRPGDVARFRRAAEAVDPAAAPGGDGAAPPAGGAAPVASPAAPPAGGALRLALAQTPTVEGALLALDVETGEVLAMVGGYDFRRSEFNRAVQARRQPGSAFKPLIYASAIRKGYTPASIVVDRPVVFDDGSGTTWRPENYGKKFLGPITLREALARSVNNATIHLLAEVGLPDVIDLAHRLGVESRLDPTLSLALGAYAVSLAELTTVYAAFPAQGRRVAPRFVAAVRDQAGKLLAEDAPLPLDGEEDGRARAKGQRPRAGDPVITPAQAFLVTSLLRAVIEDPHGTGKKARALERPLAGKTGTTNDQFDAWFVGYSPDLVAGVWVGFDEKKLLGKGETGGRAALPIWIEFMQHALADRPPRDFSVPEGIVFARIDRSTGRLADASASDTLLQPFLVGSEPTGSADPSLAASEEEDLLRMDAF